MFSYVKRSKDRTSADRSIDKACSVPVLPVRGSGKQKDVRPCRYARNSLLCRSLLPIRRPRLSSMRNVWYLPATVFSISTRSLPLLPRLQDTAPSRISRRREPC
jgi:hypothetical protein